MFPGGLFPEYPSIFQLVYKTGMMLHIFLYSLLIMIDPIYIKLYYSIFKLLLFYSSKSIDIIIVYS